MISQVALPLVTMLAAMAGTLARTTTDTATKENREGLRYGVSQSYRSLFGAPIIRTIGYWGLYWGIP